MNVVIMPNNNNQVFQHLQQLDSSDSSIARFCSPGQFVVSSGLKPCDRPWLLVEHDIPSSLESTQVHTRADETKRGTNSKELNLHYCLPTYFPHRLFVSSRRLPPVLSNDNCRWSIVQLWPSFASPAGLSMTYVPHVSGGILKYNLLTIYRTLLLV